jgi:hypothetical protein
LTAFNVSPPSISAIPGSATVTFHFSVADDDAGVNDLQISIVSPSGTVSRNASINFSPARRYNGSVTIELPPSPEAGDWEIATVIVGDASGNTQVFNAQDLRDRGFPSRLTVTGR